MDTEKFIKTLRATMLQPTHEAFAQLHFDLNLLEYDAMVDRSEWTPSEPKRLKVEPVCSASGCNDTLRTPGGLYLVGDKWLCPAHLPPMSYNDVQDDGSTIVRQRSPPVGYTKPSTAPNE